MIIALSPVLPVGAALADKVVRIMDVILHLGAHRTGSARFQNYLRGHKEKLAAQRIGVWGPERVSDGLLTGLGPRVFMPFSGDPQARAQGRVALALERRRAAGTRALVVSDEALAGSIADNLRQAALYPAIGERIARIGHVFGGQIRRVVLSVRSPECYWASALSVAVLRGRPVPAAEQVEALATSGRCWRDVITDLACALPGVDLRVAPFETHRADPTHLLRLAVPETRAPETTMAPKAATPDLKSLRRALHLRGSQPGDLPREAGRWQPFDDRQQALLRERYADDLFWLAQGADGLATLTEEDHARERGQKARRAGQDRGHNNDKERRLDRAGRV